MDAKQQQQREDEAKLEQLARDYSDLYAEFCAAATPETDSLAFIQATVTWCDERKLGRLETVMIGTFMKVALDNHYQTMFHAESFAAFVLEMGGD